MPAQCTRYGAHRAARAAPSPAAAAGGAAPGGGGSLSTSLSNLVAHLARVGVRAKVGVGARVGVRVLGLGLVRARVGVRGRGRGSRFVAHLASIGWRDVSGRNASPLLAAR